MSSSNTVTLGEIATIHDSKRVPLNSRERSLRKGAIPYYGAQGIVDYIDDHLFDGDYVLIAEDGENLRSKKQPVAFRARGKFWVNNHAHIVLGKEPWLNDFIEAFFHYTDISPYVTGAAQPKLNQANLLKIQIPFVENTAKESATLWSILQRKIEVNRQMNETLEQIGQTLFKYYFIDNPERESWREVSLSSLFDFEGGSQPPKSEHVYEKKERYVRFVQNRDYSANSHITYIPISRRNKLCSELDIMMDKYGVAGSVRFGIAGAYNVALAKISPKQNEYREFLRSHFSQEKIQKNIEAAAAASTRSSLNSNTFSGLKIKLPPEDLLKEHQKRQELIIRTILFNKNQNETISLLRDSLLPRLIDGKIQI